MKVKFLFFFIFITAITAYGQGGSNYSILGIGDINYDGNASYAGLGGTAGAMPLENTINFKNPALWSLTNSTRLQAGYKFSQNYVSNDENKLFQNNGNLSGLSVIFAIDTANKIAASMGLYPYSNVNYFSASPFTHTESGVTVQGKTEYRGSGGLNAAYIGGSSKIISDLYIGAYIFAAFGTINSTIKNEVYGDAQSGFTYDTRIDSETYLSGLGYKAGLYYEVTDAFSLGTYYEGIPSLTAIDTTVFYRESSQSIRKSISDSLDFDMPPLFGFAASYKTGKFLLGADFAMQDFSNFAYKNNEKAEFINSMMFSFGIARFGNTSYDADFTDKITYSLGFAYKDLYYKVLGQNINDMSVSLGMGIPIPRTMRLDVGIALGARGTTENGLVREFYGKLNVDISIGDDWFNPFEREFE